MTKLILTGLLLATVLSGQGIPLDVSPLPDPVEQMAREANISLEIVGADHPELPDMVDGHKRHGNLYVEFREGKINRAHVSNGDEILTPILVFHRGWNDEQPMDARAVGCGGQHISFLA